MIKLKLAVASLAAVALAGVGVAAASASNGPAKPAATNACGINCVDVHFLVPGKHYLLRDHSGLTGVNNPIALVQGSNGASAEDFTEISLGTVSPEYCEAAPNQSVPQPGSVFTARQCQLLETANLDGATTFQLAFNPNNSGPSAMCVGAWDNEATVASGFKLRLEACGVAADTVIIETDALPGATTTSGSDWLINGGSDNYSNPVVATNNGGTAWQVPTWKTVQPNGGAGVDTQEVRINTGPFTP